MPFIEQRRRDIINRLGLSALREIKPGDRCYVYYKEMVDAWNKEPRWTTAHEVTKTMLIAEGDSTTEATARFLAWHVFFNTHVMPYERKKQKENGGI